jgi:hypothetical protein
MAMGGSYSADDGNAALDSLDANSVGEASRKGVSV